MSAKGHIHAAIANVETELPQIGKTLHRKFDCVMSPAYRPELDMTPELSPEQTKYYQNLIGVLQWVVELGRIDIHVAVALLSQYLASLHQGHLEQVF
jgi:hypothetical protein